MRQPLQVIVIPYRHVNDAIEYAVFHRTDGSMWHFVSGGAEDDENEEEAAVRELREEAGPGDGVHLMRLDTMASVPKTVFSGTEHWPADLFVVPQYAFAVDFGGHEIKLSEEHDRYAWLG